MLFLVQSCMENLALWCRKKRIPQKNSREVNWVTILTKPHLLEMVIPMTSSFYYWKRYFCLTLLDWLLVHLFAASRISVYGFVLILRMRTGAEQFHSLHQCRYSKLSWVRTQQPNLTLKLDLTAKLTSAYLRCTYAETWRNWVFSSFFFIMWLSLAAAAVVLPDGN